MAVAIAVYPGGSMANQYSEGYDWSRNFISNLFAARAINGHENPARIWACLGMASFPVSYAIFFVNMAKKIPDRNVAAIIKYAGIVNILFTFLTVTPWHNAMLIISTSVFWTCIVIITVFILKTRLHLFKFLCIACLLVFYYGVYLWGISNWQLLPIIQKINFVSSTLLILALEYFTKQEDFAHIKPRKRRNIHDVADTELT
nr:hypothetical protein [uncultured Mucilaginibacter sp.]